MTRGMGPVIVECRCGAEYDLVADGADFSLCRPCAERLGQVQPVTPVIAPEPKQLEMKL